MKTRIAAVLLTALLYGCSSGSDKPDNAEDAGTDNAGDENSQLDDSTEGSTDDVGDDTGADRQTIVNEWLSPPENLCSRIEPSTGRIYCFDQPSRVLSAIMPDKTTWWSYALPGDTDSNAIWGIHTEDGYIDILAAIVADDKRGLETSRFLTTGEFVRTVPLLTETDRYREIYPTRLTTDWHSVAPATDDIANGLSTRIFSALACESALPEDLCRTFIARVNPNNGSTLAYRELPAETFADSWQIGGQSVHLAGQSLQLRDFLPAGGTVSQATGLPDATITAETIETTGNWLAAQFKGELLMSLDTTVFEIESIRQIVDSLPSGSGHQIESALSCTSGSGSALALKSGLHSYTLQLGSDQCNLDGLTLDGNFEKTVNPYTIEGTSGARISQHYSDNTVTADSATWKIAGRASYSADEMFTLHVSSDNSDHHHAWQIADFAESSAGGTTVTINESHYQHSVSIRKPAPGLSGAISTVRNIGGSLNIALSGALAAQYTLSITDNLVYQQTGEQNGEDLSLQPTDYSGTVSVVAVDGSSVEAQVLPHGAYLYQINELDTSSIQIVPESSFVGQL